MFSFFNVELSTAVRAASWIAVQLSMDVQIVRAGSVFSCTFLLNNQPDALIIQIYSVIKLYMFRAPSLSIIRSFLLYIRYWLVSCRFDDRPSKQIQDGTLFGHQTCMKLSSAECTVENS